MYFMFDRRIGIIKIHKNKFCYFSSHMKRNNNSVLISGFDDTVNFSYYVNIDKMFFRFQLNDSYDFLLI